ncbi:hypothetical protein SI65_08035 [Aspergillus cristatus]|uniref:RanBD1 domain-containing protein n=1 Tax=Aspergillus cristatus TaxID=573508 RepID=A0A1E3B6K2_ASPCR|nr:hypothetical protein SI65_08035 [Aspergillus cristatus]
MASNSRRNAEVEGDVPMEPVEQKATTDETQTSDNDGGERPVRRKLKETSITSAPQSLNPANAEESQHGGNSRASSRGRKRSFNEDEENNEEDAGHRRKRSRSSNVEEETGKVQNDLSSKIMSPQKKRSRDQLDKEEPKTGGAASKKVTEDSAEKEAKPAAEGEPEKKRHRDDSQERESKAPLPSAFANTSSVSPFGSIGASKPAAKEEDAANKPQTTSKSAFASSSLAAFSGSEQSPFSSIGGSTASVFRKPATTEPEKPKTGFVAAEGPSPFAAAAPSGFGGMSSGFAGFSGGFGAAAKTGGGLTSFAAPGGSSLLNSTSAKPFGAADEDEKEDDEEEDEAEKGPGEFEQDKTDERFFEREIETGEEEEKTYFSCKAKLFQFSDKEWRERGIGTFKVNVKVTDGKEDKKAVRLIMRADGVGRVMLNTPIFKGMNVGDATGKEPKATKQILLASLESGRSAPILLRTGSEDNARDLYRVVCDLLKEQ